MLSYEGIMHSNQPYESLHFVKYIVDILIFIKRIFFGWDKQTEKRIKKFFKFVKEFLSKHQEVFKKVLEEFFPFVRTHI